MMIKRKIKQRSHRSKSPPATLRVAIRADGMTIPLLSGFSIQEVMISMFIVSVGLVTIIQLFSTGFINSAADRDRIVAAGLAQEGLEIVKNIRDNNLVIPGQFGFEHFGVLTVGSDSDQCGLDYTDSGYTNSPAPSGTDYALVRSVGGASARRNCFANDNNPGQKYALLTDANGFFADAYNPSASGTKWTRVIYITYHDNGTTTPQNYSDDWVDVTSIVWWSGSANWPVGLLTSGGNPVPTNLSVCSALNKCVYAQLHLEAWKP